MTALLLMLLACSSPAPVSEDATLMSVKSVPIASQTFADAFTLSATVEASQFATLFPEAQGRVKRVTVRIGDKVEKGQVLMELHSTAYGGGVEQAKAAVEMATAQAEQARTHAARMETLAQREAVTSVELDQARSQLQLAEAQLAQAQAGLTVARQQYVGTQVKAPFSGVITARGVDPGDVIGAATRMPPLQIADLSSLRVVTSVSELSAGQIAVGTSLQLRVDALPGETFHATVERVNAAVDPVTRTVQIEARMDGDPRLRHGMAGEVALEGIGSQYPAIPRMALLDRDDGAARVMVLEGEQARARAIRYGRSQSDVVPVLEGLEPGERVLVAGHTRLVDGDVVKDLAQ